VRACFAEATFFAVFSYGLCFEAFPFFFFLGGDTPGVTWVGDDGSKCASEGFNTGRVGAVG
jgi:hypothetical protein